MVRNVIRKILERYGLDSKDIDALMAHFGRLEDIANSDPSKIASLTNLSKDDIVKLQDYLKNYLKSKKDNNNVGKDFLKRWGKVSSEEDLLSAYEEYNRLSRLYPKSPVVWEMRGEILEKMGRMEEAKKSYKKAYMLHIKNGDTPPRELKEKIEKKTPATTPKIGLSNGFGNINGFKNGIINGTGIVNGTSTGWSGPKGTNPWKATVAILLVFLIIAAPLVGFIFFEKHNVYAVDGNFEEWKENIPYYGLRSSDTSIDIHMVKYHLSPAGIYFYINVDKHIFANASGIYLFLDTDNSSKTGYYVDGLGADYMVELYGWNNTLAGKELYKFNGTNQLDFANFTAMHRIKAIFKDGNIEGFIPIQTKGFRAFAISSDYRGIQDVAPCMGYGVPNYIVKEESNISLIPIGEPTAVMKLIIEGKNVDIRNIDFSTTGNVKSSDIKTLELFRDNGNGKFDSNDQFIASGRVKNGNIVFDNMDLKIRHNATLFLVVNIENYSLNGKAFMPKINEIQGNQPYFVDDDILGAAYIGSIPSHPVIDGAFGDWKHVYNDSAGDVMAPNGTIIGGFPNIDLLQYGAYNAQYLYMYLKVRGEILGGADVPKIEVYTLPDSDGDTVPDKFDPYPHDFNNDGIPDNESYVIVNGTKLPDVDGDGIPDYPYGPDMWLNTTIPSWFPKPYAGRVVHRYIGPVPHHVITGMDTVEIYINADNNTATGFSLPQYPIGADYKIEIYGKDGKVYNATLYKYSGSSWKFVMHLSPKLGYHAMELNTGIRAQNPKEYIFIFDWKDHRDVADKSIAKTRSVSVKKKIKFSEENFGEVNTRATPKIIKPEPMGTFKSLQALFGEDVLVSNITNSNLRDETHPSIVRSSDGTLWVTWSFERKNGNHDIAIAYSSDDGATWNGWRLYSSRIYNTSNPVIGIDNSTNELYVFFENSTNGAYFQFFKYDPTTTVWGMYSIPSWNWWSDVKNLSVAISQGYIYLAFEYHNSSSNSTVGYIYSSDGGSSWAGPFVFAIPYWNGHPSITISSGTPSKAFIAFDYFNNYWITVAINNTELGNNTWSGIQIVGDPNSNYLNYLFPTIYASGSAIYMVFQADYGFSFFGYWIHIDWDIKIVNSTDNGATWGNVNTVTASSDDEEYPWVVASGQTVYVFYLNATTGYICMVESNDGGNTWSNAYLVSDQGSGVGIYRTVNAILSGGRLYVVWTDNRNGQDDIYFDKAEVPELNTIVMPIIILAILGIILRRRKQQ